MNDARWPNLRSFRPGVIPLGPLQMGEIFSGTIATLRSHAAVLFGAALVIVAVGQLAALAVSYPLLDELPVIEEDATPQEALAAASQGLAASLAGLPFAVLAQIFVTGIATVVVGKAVIGESLSLADAWAQCRPRLLPLLGLTVLVGALVAIGTMLFIVPGIWLMVLLSLATPALILERTTIGHALVRSKDLVRNAWWHIFGILLITLLLNFGISVIISAPFELIGGDPTGTTSGEYLVLSTIGAIAAGAVTAPIAAVVIALIYIDRRMRTEDLAVELARAAGLAPPEAGTTGRPHTG
ncbi:MAG: hypothetical protein ACRDSE_03125 [Pseudonocardiaceae bacterium]